MSPRSPCVESALAALAALAVLAALAGLLNVCSTYLAALAGLLNVCSTYLAALAGLAGLAGLAVAAALARFTELHRRVAKFTRRRLLSGSPDCGSSLWHAQCVPSPWPMFIQMGFLPDIDSPTTTCVWCSRGKTLAVLAALPPPSPVCPPRSEVAWWRFD